MKLHTVFKSKRLFCDSHKVQDLFIACSDFRFRKIFGEFLKTSKVAQTDRMIVPGGHLSIFIAQTKKFFLGWIKLLAVKHKIREIIIVGHEECAAYAGIPKYGRLGPNKLKQIQLNDLVKSKKVIQKLLPGVSVKLFFAGLPDKTGVAKIYKIR